LDYRVVWVGGFGDVEIGARFDFSQGLDGQFVDGGDGFIKRLWGDVGERVQALFKFRCGLICEGDDFHLIRGDSQFKQGGDTIGDDFGFARASACDTEASFIGGEGGLCLVFVEEGIWGVQKVFKDGVFMLFAEEGEQGVKLRKRTFGGFKEGEQSFKHKDSFL